jgi:hypothetical protein
MVNEQLYSAVLNGARPAEDSRYVPVMYPLILPNSVASTVLKPDDMASLRSLYPEAKALSLGAISGAVESSEAAPVHAANIIARRTDDPLCQAVAAVSGRECTPMVDSQKMPNVLSESCASTDDAGRYVIRGMMPGEYTLEVNEIVEGGGARSNMFPKGGGRDLPGEPQIIPRPVFVAGTEVPHQDFKLSPVAAVHQTGIDMSLLMKSGNSECRTDPVSYKEFLSFAAPTPADSAPIAAPQPPAMGGCSLIR